MPRSSSSQKITLLQWFIDFVYFPDGYYLWISKGLCIYCVISSLRHVWSLVFGQKWGAYTTILSCIMGTVGFSFHDPNMNSVYQPGCFCHSVGKSHVSAYEAHSRTLVSVDFGNSPTYEKILSK